MSSSRRHTIRDSQKTEALQNGEVSTVAVALPPRTSINVHDLSEFISGERAMAGAMRTCATTASLTSLAPPRIASAANGRALPSIPLRPASSRTPRRGVSWSAPPSSSVSDIETAVVASPPALEQDSAAEVVRRFYGGINSQDLSAVEGLIADKCVYEDLIFPRPFVGREVRWICPVLLLYIWRYVLRRLLTMSEKNHIFRQLRIGRCLFFSLQLGVVEHPTNCNRSWQCD